MFNMSKYGMEGGNGSKRLLVPIIALLLCATALAGVGYAALTSSVSNSGNEVGSSFAILTIKDEDGVQNATISGDAVIDYGTVSFEEGTQYFVESNRVEIGWGTLEVDASEYKGNGAGLSYKVLVLNSEGKYVESPSGILEYIIGFELEIKVKDADGLLAMNGNAITTTIESGEEYEYEFTLKAVFDSGYDSGIIEDNTVHPLGTDAPEQSFKYRIIFTMTVTMTVED